MTLDLVQDDREDALLPQRKKLGSLGREPTELRVVAPPLDSSLPNGLLVTRDRPARAIRPGARFGLRLGILDRRDSPFGTGHQPIDGTRNTSFAHATIARVPHPHFSGISLHEDGFICRLIEAVRTERSNGILADIC
ncbi:hypothetical protein Mnod_7714 (plasmid) [Methylobacterium nodulans ORS 2060]|uniref:Uncharacterized protein n=1 Tax=Methylobacterium nodulans (strain LMG 21967 / CNCM I-2342 / ORS 2060) TaxID=460265 RepID=B8IY17_METNO|nr:hypothetical protein Mnod_7714 [Methylobacterium nodulans ORS 2060]